MNNGIAILTFAIGATIGSVVTWKLIEHKYKTLVQEEIDSVKESFSRAYGEKTEETSVTDIYANMMSDFGYSGSSEKSEKEEDNMTSGPYVISPDEFGEKDYETITLTYYNDRVLANNFDERIDDPEELVGNEALGSFGEYEDDAVFVRNDSLRIDYEILLDMRDYSDVVGEE